MARALGVAVAMPAALAGAPAAAAAVENLQPSGSITYTWQGDPARGCAADGLCGVQGALIVQPQGSTAGNSSGGMVDVRLVGSGSTVRVAGPGGDCVDVPGNQFGGDLLLVRQAHGSMVGQIEPPLSSGRCAGPTAQDLAGLTLPVRRSGGRRPSYDLRASETFAAGPFTGQLVSTLVLRPAPGYGGVSTSGSSSGTAIPVITPVKRVLVEQVTLRYRIASLSGTLDTTFSGEPDPFCAALASCGTSGNLTVGIRPFGGTLVVTASREVPQRVNASQAIADLRRGRLLMQGAGLRPFRPPFVSTATTETFSAADGSRCQAAGTSQQAQLFFGPGPGPARPLNALTATMIETNPSGLMRTYCPGPTDSDVFGQEQVLADGSVGAAGLLRRHSVLSLTHPGAFAGVGYVGTRGGALQFSLSLESVRGGTVEAPPGVVPVPPPGVVP